MWSLCQTLSHLIPHAASFLLGVITIFIVLWMCKLTLGALKQFDQDHTASEKLSWESKQVSLPRGHNLITFLLLWDSG